MPDATYKFAPVSETDGRLFPSEVKGALVYRTENTEGPVSFIGTVTVKGSRRCCGPSRWPALTRRSPVGGRCG